MRPWKVILAAAIIFISGLVVGGLIARKQTSPRTATASPRVSSTNGTPSFWNQMQRDFLRKLDRELALTPEQHGKIELILKQSGERSRAIREKVAPEMREELKRVREQIKAELTDEQKGKFDEAVRSKNPRKPEHSSEEFRDRPMKDGHRRSRTNSQPQSFPPPSP